CSVEDGDSEVAEEQADPEEGTEQQHAEDLPEQRPLRLAAHVACTSSANAASSRLCTPTYAALARLLPALLPATTCVTALLIESTTRAPRASTSSLAWSRVKRSSDPVKQNTAPASGPSAAGVERGAACGSTPAARAAARKRWLLSCRKNPCTARATSLPTP